MRPATIGDASDAGLLGRAAWTLVKTLVAGACFMGDSAFAILGTVLLVQVISERQMINDQLKSRGVYY